MRMEVGTGTARALCREGNGSTHGDRDDQGWYPVVEMGAGTGTGMVGKGWYWQGQ